MDWVSLDVYLPDKNMKKLQRITSYLSGVYAVEGPLERLFVWTLMSISSREFAEHYVKGACKASVERRMQTII